MLFKEIPLNGLFTFADKETYGPGVYRRTTARKFKSEADVADQPITSINIEVEPWSPEISARVGGRATALLQQAIETARAEGRAIKIVPELQNVIPFMDGYSIHGNLREATDEIIAESAKFDPMKLISDLRAKSWRNYTVTEYRDGDAIVTKLGALVGNEDFMETVTWDGDGNPIFQPDASITFPEGVEEADWDGFMEAAIPDVYKRRVMLYRAQGMTGMDLYNRLVIDNRPISFGGGKGVNRAAHLSIVKTKTRKNNRSRRASRVSNLRLQTR